MLRYSLGRVIRSFRHKGLEELFEAGTTSKVRPDLVKRTLRRLDALDQAASVVELNVPGFAFHGLKGKSARYKLARQRALVRDVRMGGGRRLARRLGTVSLRARQGIREPV